MTLIDCDVHCPTPTVEQLCPFLDDFWADFLRDGRFAMPAALPAMYPPNAPTTSRLAGPATVERLVEHIDEEGADRAIVNCVYGLEGLRNPDLASALARAVNDWLAETVLPADPRLAAGIVVAPDDPSGAVEEIERRADDERFVHALLPGRAMRPYGDRFYWPLLAAAVAARRPVALHFGGSSGIPPTQCGWPSYYLEEYVGVSQVLQGQITSLVGGQALVRYPDLRIVVLEGGFTWFPALMWRLDKDWKGMFQREVPWLTAAPSEFVRKHVRAAVQPIDGPDDPARLIRVVEQVGSPEFLMFSSDFPHRHLRTFEEAFDGRLPEETERLIRGGTAGSLYGL